MVRDYSWPLQDTNVLHVATPSGADFIVKASTTSHHIHREIAAHGPPGLLGERVLRRPPGPVARPVDRQPGLPSRPPGNSIGLDRSGHCAQAGPKRIWMRRGDARAGVAARGNARRLPARNCCRATVIKVIDFGRAGTASMGARPGAAQPPAIRSAGQTWREAFQAGLGRTVAPAEADLWRLENLNQAIGTVVWATPDGRRCLRTGRAGHGGAGCWPVR